MRHKTLVILFFLCFLSAVGWSQTAKDETVSEQEKAALLKVTKRFVKQMQQTRDINKLSRDLFVKNDEMGFFGTILLPEAKDNISGYNPTPQQMRRFSIAGMNYMYLLGLDVVNDTSINFKKTLSPSLGRRMASLVDEMEILERGFTKNQFQSLLVRMERSLAAVSLYLRKKNIEQSQKFKKAIAEREKDAFTNYSIEVTLSDAVQDADNDIESLIRRFGPGVKVFFVGTPFGFALLIVKQQERYKIFGMYPHPFS